jgi:hypothetical protein
LDPLLVIERGRTDHTRITMWIPPAVGARASLARTISAEDVELFAAMTGDRNPLHFDPEFAASTRFGRLVVQGGVTAEVEVIEARDDKPIPKLRCSAKRHDGVEVLRGKCIVYTMQPDPAT